MSICQLPKLEIGVFTPISPRTYLVRVSSAIDSKTKLTSSKPVLKRKTITITPIITDCNVVAGYQITTTKKAVFGSHLFIPGKSSTKKTLRKLYEFYGLSVASYTDGSYLIYPKSIREDGFFVKRRRISF